jgi:hypothetical protein
MMKNTNDIFKFMGLFALIFMISCSGNQKKADTVSEEPTETEAEDDGWVSIFDGKTLNGWKRYNKEDIGPLWQVQDGMIFFNGSGLGEGSGEDGGTLITIKQYGNFEFSVDWKIAEGGNSGLLYHVVESPEYSHAYNTGPEYQLIDDNNYHETIKGLNAVAANYDMYAASPDKKLNPPGDWNTSKIVYNNGHVEHWLNGDKVLEFEEGSDDWKARYEKSKWASGDYPGWCKYKVGSLGLQDHGANLWFRNIKAKEL